MKSLIRRLHTGLKKKELIPYIQKERYSCPFYGFSGMFGIFIDSAGNQCGLETRSYSPCPMESKGEKPCWDKCYFNTEETNKAIETTLKDVKVFPAEFRPPGLREWEGISLKKWMDYILKDK